MSNDKIAILWVGVFDLFGFWIVAFLNNNFLDLGFFEISSRDVVVRILFYGW